MTTLREAYNERFAPIIGDGAITIQNVPPQHDVIADFFISRMRGMIEKAPTLNTLNFPEGEVELIARGDLLTEMGE